MTEKKPVTINVILAEDHQIVRNGLRVLLEKETGIKLVGEAGSGTEVFDLLKRGVEADILITDINMPGLGGLELLQQLKDNNSALRVIVLSMMDNQKFIIKAFKAGASGYLLKNVANDEMVFAVKHVCAGNNYICGEIAFDLLNRQIKLPELNQTQQATDLELSKRDIEVLNLIADGYTNDEVADKLFTSKRTVEGYRQNLIARTGTRNTAALIKFAFVNGLLNN